MQTYEPMAGESIDQAAVAMVKLANETGLEVRGEFNGQSIVAQPGDIAEAISAGYMTECKRRHEPYLASPEYAEVTRQAEEKRTRHDADLKRALAGCPEHLTLSDAEGWRHHCEVNAPYPYGNAVVQYAERWARLMEMGIANGQTIASCAKELSNLANNDGITGYMYGAAVGILAKVWIHGEELRRWHNHKTQIGDEGDRANEEGGVLNPALLHIG